MLSVAIKPVASMLPVAVKFTTLKPLLLAERLFVAVKLVVHSKLC